MVVNKVILFILKTNAMPSQRVKQSTHAYTTIFCPYYATGK